MYGEVPVTRFRHTVVVITPEPTSKIGILVNEVLHPVQHDAAQGSVVLLFGGYNTMGQEFGGDQFEVCSAQALGDVLVPSSRFICTLPLSNVLLDLVGAALWFVGQANCNGVQCSLLVATCM